MPKKISAYQANDGSVHPTLDQAVAHDLHTELTAIIRRSLPSNFQKGDMQGWLMRQREPLAKAFLDAEQALNSPEVAP